MIPKTPQNEYTRLPQKIPSLFLPCCLAFSIPPASSESLTIFVHFLQSPVSSPASPERIDTFSQMGGTIAWIIAVCCLIYLILVLRYYYTVPPDTNVTILQCTAESFHPRMLRERSPIVCRGVGNLMAFRNAWKPLNRQATAQPQTKLLPELYASINIDPWFCRQNPVQYFHYRTHADVTAGRQTLKHLRNDVTMLVQMRGTRRISVFAPRQLARFRTAAQTPPRPHPACGEAWLSRPSDADRIFAKAQYTDFQLYPGDALLLPFQWWYTDAAADDNTNSTTPTTPIDECGGLVLGWENTLGSLVHAHFMLG